MDDGVHLPIPSHRLFLHPEMPHGFDELLKNTTTCTYSHTWNPPGPSVAMHMHTCLHAHIQTIPPGENNVEAQLRKTRKPLGNREAVRKYREKKKAYAAFLEEEVKKLCATNQQLLRRLQGYVSLEAEVVRLRGLLFDIQGKIDAEIGTSPFQKQCSFGSVTCTDNSPSFNTNTEVAAREECSRPMVVDCGIDESSIISHELDIPEMANLMDGVPSFVNSASLTE
ncbi:hypothetical protein GUJ93_ZPchr0001g31006 [Zizania palustris]|uniref:BZIP domain-containing protein n=1 Tax=Zizania palustris TaxID=103762 RepID=A0A8J5SG75_ZIZPA|nr:hypothetical protein GUJ93_ZPchr0001g31006 [Zizania palustris]